MKPLQRVGRDPGWGDLSDHDFGLLSATAYVDLRDHLARDVPTLVQFGAPFCGPCKKGARQIGDALRGGAGFALRGVWLHDVGDLDAPMARAWLPERSYPYYRVFHPDGTEVYAGSSVDEALAAAR